MGNFELRDISKLGLFTNTEKLASGVETMEVGLENLQHYHKHPFKLYSGQRFADMVESIKENGLLSPLIVRPTHEDHTRYEILSGHNRYEACKLAGMYTVPCILKRNITEDEAYLIVTESNLIQRSFSDLSHSERAVILATHYDAIKNQGKRSEFIKTIEDEIKNIENNGQNPSNYQENSTSPQIGTKLRSDEIIASEYGLAKNTVARYIRINKLVEVLKNKIDLKELSLIAGVSLSYLTEREQLLIADYMDDHDFKIDIKKAEKIRGLSESKKLSERTLEELFTGKKATKTSTSKSSNVIKIKRKKYERFFIGKESQTEIEDTLEKALEFYFKFKDTVPSTEEEINNEQEEEMFE